jgi:putative endonuclease
MSKVALSAQKSWWVYIVETDKGMLYTGISTDVVRRIKQHAGVSKGGAKFFRSQAPVRLCFKKKFPNRSEASKYEAYVKSLKRAEKLLLFKNKRN